MGFGKSGMEGIVEEEIEELCSNIEKEKGPYISMTRKFNLPVLGALWHLMTSEKLKHDDPRLLEVGRKFEQLTSGPGLLIQLAQFLPGVGKVLEYFDIMDLGGIVKDCFKLADDISNSHEESYQEDSTRDFTDVYIKKRLENDGNGDSSFHGSDGKINQRNLLVDLIIAGSETTSATLSWAILLMARHPDIQKKVQAELDAVTGGSRKPSWNDRQQTPYTEAVLHEIQRVANILPAAVLHMANTDTKVASYTIPKGTQVIANLGGVLYSPKYFPNPYEFNPNRYLKDGKFEPSSQMIAFGWGKRRCLGESLARLELYNFFTIMIHRYSVEKKPGVELTLEHLNGSALPLPYEAKFTLRN